VRTWHTFRRGERLCSPSRRHADGVSRGGPGGPLSNPLCPPPEQAGSETGQAETPAPTDVEPPAGSPLYGRHARWYEWLARGEWRCVEAGLRLLAAREGERVLEVGCGPGRALVRLAGAVGAGGHAYALDASWQMCRLARERIRRAGCTGRPAVLCANAMSFPLADDDAMQAETPARTSAGAAPHAFDAIFMSFTLELFDELMMQAVLAECRRVLRPGGRLCVVAMARGKGGAVERLYKWLHARWPAWVDCRPIAVRETLQQAGLAVAGVREMAVWGLPVAVVLAGKG